MKHLIAALLLLAMATAAAAQDSIPEDDWEWQKRNQGRRIEGGFTRYNMEIDHPELRQPKRCPPQRVIVVERVVGRVVERVVERRPRYGWVTIGWDYHHDFGVMTPRKMWLPVE